MQLLVDIHQFLLSHFRATHGAICLKNGSETIWQREVAFFIILAGLLDLGEVSGHTHVVHQTLLELLV